MDQPCYNTNFGHEQQIWFVQQKVIALFVSKELWMYSYGSSTQWVQKVDIELKQWILNDLYWRNLTFIFKCFYFDLMRRSPFAKRQCMFSNDQWCWDRRPGC